MGVMEQDYEVYAIHTDHLGTPVAVSDLSGQVVWTHRFSPFGKTIELNEDADGDGVTLTLNLRFPGQYYDAESGLHYNWYRYYDPETGRYVTIDESKMTVDESNLYLYDLNPIKNKDFNGNSNCVRWYGNYMNIILNLINIFGGGCEDEMQCSPTYFICDKIDFLGRAKASTNRHSCEIKIRNSTIYEGSSKRLACSIAHEHCHLSTGDYSECRAYTVQKNCLDYFNKDSSGAESMRKRFCDDKVPTTPNDPNEGKCNDDGGDAGCHP